jgi:hypothetical protein
MSQATYTVEALTPDDAVDIAKRRARDEGLRILTVSRVVAVDPPSRTERTRWLVSLSVRDVAP